METAVVQGIATTTLINIEATSAAEAAAFCAAEGYGMSSGLAGGAAAGGLSAAATVGGAVVVGFLIL